MNEVQRKADEQAAQRIAEITDLAAKIDGADAMGLKANDANRFISTSRSFFLSHYHHLLLHALCDLPSLVRIGEVQRLKEKTGKRKARTMLLFNNLIAFLTQSEKKSSKYLYSIDWFAKMGDVSLVDMADQEVNGILHCLPPIVDGYHLRS